MYKVKAMKPWVAIFIFELVLLICIIAQSQAQTLVTSAEAETGILTGTNIATTRAGYSGTGYVTGFDNSADKLKVIVSVSEKGLYKVIIRAANNDYKEQYVAVNLDQAIVKFPASASFTDVDAGVYLFNAGKNSISVKNSWGYIDIDKISVYTTVKNTYNITESLVDASANTTTKKLYDTLRSYFGKKMISGQTDNYYDFINTKTGRKPRLRAWDFQHFTEGYAYKWDNDIGGHTFGAEDDGSVDRAIAWYNDTNKKGIVSFQWHWHSPSGGTAGTNTFYSDQTTFDVTKAVTDGTEENTLIIRDIDAIAVQLKKLEAADVPVLWRPLHEAGGQWFWWGEKGATACKALYNIVFDRLTNFHGIHNLIWVWSTPEADWYPGNAKVDIIGYDSYPGAFNYGMQKNMFDALHQVVDGQKLIAMSENGPIPDPENCLTLDAPWLYFMSWGDLVEQQNSSWHMYQVFQHPDLLSFPGNAVTPPQPDPEPQPDPDIVTSLAEINSNHLKVYPNPAINGTLHVEGDLITRIELQNLDGKKMLIAEHSSNTISTAEYANGIYILSVYANHNLYHCKVFINN
jgi:mannan endo-1,4-beta-mannosidase